MKGKRPQPKVKAMGDWYSRGSCVGKPLTIWFPPSYHPTDPLVQQAKEICRTCPVQDVCLQDAISRDTPEGIAGGMTPRERRNLTSEFRSVPPPHRRCGTNEGYLTVARYFEEYPETSFVKCDDCEFARALHLDALRLKVLL